MKTNERQRNDFIDVLQNTLIDCINIPNMFVGSNVRIYELTMKNHHFEEGRKKIQKATTNQYILYGFTSSPFLKIDTPDERKLRQCTYAERNRRGNRQQNIEKNNNFQIKNVHFDS